MKTTTYLIGLSAIGMALIGCSKTDEKGDADLYNVTPLQVRSIDPGRRSVAFIIDTSSSMDGSVSGKRKIDGAKQALKGILEQYKDYNEIHHNVEAGLFYFRGSFPTTVAQDLPIRPFDYSTLVSRVSSLEANASSTPLGISLAYVERALDRAANGQKNIVLLTDGANTAGKSPESIFASINATNKGIGDSETTLYVVAFDTDPENFRKLREHGAIVYGAKDARELEKVLAGSTEAILAEQPIDVQGQAGDLIRQ